MSIDESLGEPFSPEETARIRRRVCESPSPGPDAEKEFDRFFEGLRQSAELYTMLMFRDVKIISLDFPRGSVTIRDREGTITVIDLSTRPDGQEYSGTDAFSGLKRLI